MSGHLPIGQQGRFGFEDAYLANRVALYNYFPRCGVPADGADDLVQSVFVALLENASRYDDQRAPLPVYLFGIARNLRREWTRRQRRWRWISRAEPTTRDSTDAAIDIASVVARLPEDQREAIVLRELLGLNYEEIGQVCSVPLGTVRSRLARAREALRRPTGKEKLPQVHHRMSIFDSWNTTVLADTGTGARLDLRISARFSERKDPAVLEGTSFKMHLSAGPLIEIEPPGTPDTLVFTQVSMNGRGIMFGLPGLGVVKLSTTQFPGSTRCGSVSGHSLGFAMEDAEYRVVSQAPILPEGEWLLFGLVEPWPPDKPVAPFYGPFLLPGEKP